MPTLGEQITKDRKKKEMSQKELAGRVRKEDGQPISPQFLNDLERDRRRPSNQILKSIAEVLSASVDEYHLLAGQLPPDVIGGEAAPGRVAEVMKALRRTYPG
jgi:transcriptional regulator with XRE-family HTH domain